MHVYDIAIISKSILESKTFPCHSTAKNLLQPFVDSLQKTKEFALVEKRDHLKTCFVQDNDVDKDCQFCEEGGTIPNDTCMQLCVLCSHGNIDFPASNAPNQATSDRNHQQYETELAEFEADKDAWKAKNSKTKPVELKLMSVYYQCHCYQISCSGYKEGNCQEYKASPPTIGKDGKCPCEVGQCICLAWKQQWISVLLPKRNQASATRGILVITSLGYA
jgi:hypothetical protein